MLASKKASTNPTFFKHFPSSGFTLLEFVIVLVIIGILGMVAIPRFANTTERSRVAATQAEMREIQKAIMGDEDFRGYRSDVGSLPTNLTDLVGAMAGYNPFTETGTRGDYLSAVDSDGNLDGGGTAIDALEDAWGNDYTWNSGTGVITSLGADGAAGGAGLNADITLDVDG